MKNALGQRASKDFLTGLQKFKGIRSEAQKKRFLVAVDFQGKDKAFRKAALVRSLVRAQDALQVQSGVVVPVGSLLESLADSLEEFAGF